eukprot:CAMPEP_0181248454 /NCGR_PEP_ID=MMETSP1096-20121128/45174_1 /TAXON_ID=156174 ORGANISM="Chrysochromulina ericina, Strain CCMP281" /NCGR_SAMPLE_ID=MMETSP1096 /ASSEMBLY_ACC=CAM_ASM_000453 /LENGTH=143 /DNA_ID=CAMNT_0023345615 /DNA_START=170 /DNA_END=602 /DNA_ORIENTATION=+
MPPLYTHQITKSRQTSLKLTYAARAAASLVATAAADTQLRIATYQEDEHGYNKYNQQKGEMAVEGETGAARVDDCKEGAKDDGCEAAAEGAHSRGEAIPVADVDGEEVVENDCGGGEDEGTGDAAEDTRETKAHPHECRGRGA